MLDDHLPADTGELRLGGAFAEEHKLQSGERKNMQSPRQRRIGLYWIAAIAMYTWVGEEGAFDLVGGLFGNEKKKGVLIFVIEEEILDFLDAEGGFACSTFSENESDCHKNL
jgi:hypothetical protein